MKVRNNLLAKFDLTNKDNYDLTVILSLSSYFNHVSLEYFSRILHSYATEVLQLQIPQLERHYYYRSCMNIYATCLYQMFSSRAKVELHDYIKRKKKFLNASTKFNHKTKSCVKPKRDNKLLQKINHNINQLEPVFTTYKLLRYQSHVLGNIADGNILDYLFINYINTPRFLANLKFINTCFISSFDKADQIINHNSKISHKSGITTTAPSSPIQKINSKTFDNLNNYQNTSFKIDKNQKQKQLQNQKQNKKFNSICKFLDTTNNLTNDNDNNEITSLDNHSGLLH